MTLNDLHKIIGIIKAEREHFEELAQSLNKPDEIGARMLMKGGTLALDLLASRIKQDFADVALEGKVEQS